MNKFYLLMLVMTLSANAQTYQWLKTSQIDLTLNPGMVAYCTTVDMAGNAYITGYSDQAFLYGQIFGELLYNKYDASGTLLYSHSFSGHGMVYDIAADASGNVVLAIGYVELITIGTLSLSTTEQGIRPLLVKLDSEGNVLWHFEPQIGGIPASSFSAVTVDTDGNIYAGYDNYNNSYIEKISPDGDSILTITQLNVKVITSLDIDTEGNIYSAGSCAEPGASFAGTSVPTSLTYNTWIAKYSSAGQYQWAKYVEDITCSSPQVRANTPDEVYFSSYLFGAYAFDSITALGPASGMFNDFFVAKLNTSGTFQWVREVPGTGTVYTGSRNFLDTDSQGNVYFSGSSRGNIDWGNGIATTGIGTSSDALVLKYDKDGVLLLAKANGGLSDDRIDGVKVSVSGDIYVGGLARQSTNFDGIEHISDDFIPYPFVGRIGEALAVDVFKNNNLSIYPNPVSDYLHVQGTKETITGKIFNLVGQRVMAFEGNRVDVSSLENGLYLVDLGHTVVKIIKL